MKKFLLGFAIGAVFTGLVVLVIGFAMVAVFARGAQPPPVGSNSVLVYKLSGEVPEQAPTELPIPWLGESPPITVVESWQMLRQAAGDARIQALVLEPRGLDAGWAKLQELRAQVLKFKESGKPVFAYLRSPGTREYYVASAADQVFMAPEEWLDIKGLRAELTYVKRTLDKLGVEMEFEGVGLYKDAPDMFTETRPSPQTLEVTNAMLDQYFGDLVSVIAQGRGKKPEQIRALIDQGPFLGPAALAGGLVDGLLFEDEMFARLKERLQSGEELAKVRAEHYSRASVPGAKPGARIAVIAGAGDILPDAASELGDVGMTAAKLTPVIDQVAEDPSIRGVIFRVDSPGGDAVAADAIWHAAKNLSAKKPVLISMSDYAASGGYLVSMTGDPVLAYENTLTGSIGVFFGKVNLRGLYAKIGVDKHVLTRGRWAALDSDYQPLGPGGRERLQRELQAYYRGFVQKVAEARKQPYDAIEPLAQGRVWTGAQARNNGLIDELGGLDRAVERIKERAKIGAAEPVTLVMYPPRRTLLQVLLERNQPATEVEARIGRVVGRRFPWRALVQGGVLSLTPVWVEVR
jgi:protease-4